MSKTDKTAPYWVKLKSKSSARRETHDHRDGICDFAEATRTHCFWPSKCGYTVSYYGYNAGFFEIRSPWIKAERALSHRSARAKLRKDLHNMLKLDTDGVEEYDVINPRHRHGAIWNS